jgi:ABC-type transport system involved in multi-copper enzyme maturation permease subunit
LALAFWLFVVTCLFAALSYVDRDRNLGFGGEIILGFGGEVISTLICVAGGCLLIGAGLHAAGSVSRERERHTLDLLRCIPIDRRRILTVKWYGTIRRMHWYLLLLLVQFLVTCMADSSRTLRNSLLMLAIASHVAFAVSLGLFCSVACRTTKRAYLAWTVVMFIVVVLCPLLVDWQSDSISAASSTLGIELSESLNRLTPIECWYRLCVVKEVPQKYFVASQPDSSLSEADAILTFGFGIIPYLLASAVLFLAALWLFRREGERG